MERRENGRGFVENFVEGRHLKLDKLKKEDKIFECELSNYLFKENIPEYPRPEFHVSHLKHDTDRDGLTGIRRDGGFRTLHPDSVLWWSLAVGPDDVTSAETRLLEKTFPHRTQEQVQRQQSFLGKFATSPAFMETSRMGSYRFTFPLEEVLEAYREQFCSGACPVMRVFKTVLYKQEVMYVVLVHSPQANQEQFSKYPLLTDDPNAVCTYRDGRFIWRPEAMCETHSYELIQRRDKNQMEVRELPKHHQEFYVWDHVAVALHVDEAQVLRFDADRLRENLTFCDAGHPTITPRYQFDELPQAEKLVKDLWPDHPKTRYPPLLQDPRSQSDHKKNLSSSHTGLRTENDSKNKTTGPQTLIVGDFAIKGLKGRRIKKTWTYCFPTDLLCDVTEKIPDLLSKHPSVKNIVVHVGANDVMKRPSEFLKQDFRDLLNTLSSFDTRVFISGPVPPVRIKIERFSRLLALNTWLSPACTQHNVHFIDNFNSFWKRRRFFGENGIHLNKSGINQLIRNLRHSVPSLKMKRTY